jgi:hypothetical protein
MTTTPIYQVVDWDDHFENNKSRERDECSFVAVPNKQDGLGLTYILNEADGTVIYGIWCLIIGACSRQRRHDRGEGKLGREGYLTDNGLPAGRPWGARDLALRWRRPVTEVQRALDYLCSPEIGWLRVVGEDRHVTRDNAEGLYQSARQVPAGCPSGALDGMGWEGMGKEPPNPQGGNCGGGERKTGAAAEPAGFTRWWAAYPSGDRKDGKAKCLKKWKQMGLESITDRVIASLELQKKSKKWTKDGGQFIPGPEPWLNKTPWLTDLAELGAKPADVRPTIPDRDIVHA